MFGFQKRVGNFCLLAWYLKGRNFMHCQYCQEADQAYQGKLAAIKTVLLCIIRRKKLPWRSKSFRVEMDNQIYITELDDLVYIQCIILVKIQTRQELVYEVVFTCSLTMIMPTIAFLDPLITSLCQSSSSQRQKECLKMSSLCWQANMAQLLFGYMVKLLQKNRTILSVYKNL